MTVHLLRAADYAPDDYFDVTNPLTTLNLPGWSFVIPEVEIDPDDVMPGWGGGRRQPEDVRFAYVSPVEKITYQHDRNVPLSWQELFDIGHYYRNLRPVPETDMVVLLTRRPNALNWFSAFDKHRNVFIHTADWQQFIPCDPKYPVAYQVLSNALQWQMARDLPHKEAMMHDETIGCMNDFCEHKGQIAFKLRTGDICTDCLNKLKVAEVPDVIVDAALAGFDQLRRQMLFRQGFRRRGPGPVVVSKRYQILLPDQGNLEVKMPSRLSRVLCVFFLHHPEGIRLAELTDHRAELLALYERMGADGQRIDMEKRIARLVNTTENSLNENLSRIRKALNTALGEDLAGPYQITGEPGERYQITLPPDLIRIPTQ